MKKLLVAVMFGFLSLAGLAAGITFIQIPPDSQGPALKAAVWPPCSKAPRRYKLDPTHFPARRDCPIVGEKLPLVVISHGHGGEHFGHHDLAETLADAGFIVAAIDHPGDTFSDMSRATEPSEFVERPMDIKRLIDYMLSSYRDASRIRSAGGRFLQILARRIHRTRARRRRTGFPARKCAVPRRHSRLQADSRLAITAADMDAGPANQGFRFGGPAR